MHMAYEAICSGCAIMKLCVCSVAIRLICLVIIHTHVHTCFVYCVHICVVRRAQGGSDVSTQSWLERVIIHGVSSQPKLIQLSVEGTSCYNVGRRCNTHPRCVVVCAALLVVKNMRGVYVIFRPLLYTAMPCAELLFTKESFTPRPV